MDAVAEKLDLVYREWCRLHGHPAHLSADELYGALDASNSGTEGQRHWLRRYIELLDATEHA